MSFLDLVGRLRNNVPAPGDCQLAAAHLETREAALAERDREIARLREALYLIATESHYEEDEYRYQLQDMIDAAREVAQEALSQGTEETDA